jgi:integrase
MDDAQVKAALGGAATLAPPTSKRPKRAPFTIALIERILTKLDPSNPLDAAVAAALTTMFFTVARVGEFTVPSVERFNPAIHVKRSDVRPEEDRHGLQVTVFALPWTKCAPAGEEVYWARQQGPADPQAALHNHFLINDPAPTDHLFAYRHAKGLRPLTRRAFLDRIAAVALSIGVTHLKGHGIRIGATLEYLLRGVPFDVVKLMGRWGSESFILYLRKHAMIMAPYMQNHPLLEPFTRYTLPPLRRR